MAYKIVLDAGHGGTDPGAVYNGRNEKDDNLALAQAVGKILEDNGVDVVYTRTEDIYPEQPLRRQESQITQVQIILSLFIGIAALKIINIRA